MVAVHDHRLRRATRSRSRPSWLRFGRSTRRARSASSPSSASWRSRPAPVRSTSCLRRPTSSPHSPSSAALRSGPPDCAPGVRPGGRGGRSSRRPGTSRCGSPSIPLGWRDISQPALQVFLLSAVTGVVLVPGDDRRPLAGSRPETKAFALMVGTFVVLLIAEISVFSANTRPLQGALSVPGHAARRDRVRRLPQARLPAPVGRLPDVGRAGDRGFTCPGLGVRDRRRPVRLRVPLRARMAPGQPGCGLDLGTRCGDHHCRCRRGDCRRTASARRPLASLRHRAGPRHHGDRNAERPPDHARRAAPVPAGRHTVDRARGGREGGDRDRDTALVGLGARAPALLEPRRQPRASARRRRAAAMPTRRRASRSQPTAF